MSQPISPDPDASLAEGDVVLRRSEIPDGDRYYPCQSDGKNVPGKTNVLWSAGVPWLVIAEHGDEFIVRPPLGGRPVIDVTGGR